MQFQSTARLQAAAAKLRMQLWRLFPDSIVGRIEQYAWDGFYEKVLMQYLVLAVQSRHWRENWYDKIRPIGLSTLGHTSALDLSFMCVATSKFIRVGDLDAAQRAGAGAFMATAITKTSTTLDDLWEFLCGAPSRVDGALAAAGDPRRPERVRAALVDFATRVECAARARSVRDPPQKSRPPTAG